METLKAEFGKNLKKYLKENGISEKKLSEMSGIPEKTIYSMTHSGKSTKQTAKPLQSTIDAICKALSVSDYYLLYGIKFFNLSKFNQYLHEKKVSLEDLAIEGVCLSPHLVCCGQMPSLKEQQAIADYLGVDRAELFDAHVSTNAYLRAMQISRKRKEGSQKNNEREDIDEIYGKLSSKHKDIVYALAYDLYKIEIGEILDK